MEAIGAGPIKEIIPVSSSKGKALESFPASLDQDGGRWGGEQGERGREKSDRRGSSGQG